MLCMNGYDSDMAPELLLRSGKRTTEPALSRRWRLLQASTKLKVRVVHLQVNRLQDGCSGDEMRAAWATSSESSNGNSGKQHNKLAAAAHGKTGRPAQELNHVNLVHDSSRSEKPQAESTLPITCGVTRLAVRKQQLSHLPTPSWSQQQTQCLQRRPPR